MPCHGDGPLGPSDLKAFGFRFETVRKIDVGVQTAFGVRA